MIVAFSTSSPLTSVSLLSEKGDVLWSGEEVAPGRSSETCIVLLERGLGETGLQLSEATLFVSDVGPGSFTGVRVGIVLAKSLAWNFGVECAAIDAFDLVSARAPVAIPSRKGEYFLRQPGEEPLRTRELPESALGYGFGEDPTFPHAAAVGGLLPNLERVSAYSLMPKYLAEPSISTPKRPLSKIPVD